MRIKSPVLRALLAVGLGARFPHAAPATEAAHGPNVLVVADAITTPEGFRPAPGKPIYYILRQSYLFLGDAVAGIKLPQSAFIERTVEAELAKQGFVKTQVGGPIPSVLVLAIWGETNFSDTEASGPNFFRRADRLKIENIVGTNKPSVNTLGDLNTVASASNEDRLYLCVAAYEAATFKNLKTRQLLWRTSMSIDQRNDFTLALPTMLASGGPFFGTEVNAPAVIDDKSRRKFDVEIGEAKVVPEDGKSGAKK